MKFSGLIPGIGFLLVFGTSLPARELSDYRLGDTVEADITTPVALRVVNPEETAALKEKEGLRVPAIFQFDPTTADAVEADFRAAFENTRSNYLRRVRANFHKSELSDTDLATPKYQRIAAALLRQRRLLPVSTNLLETWASGGSGRVVQSSVIARLREAMNHPTRPDFLPTGFKLSGRLRIVAVTNLDQTLTLDEAKQRGQLIYRTNLLVPWRVRKELLNSFSPEERTLARFAAATLQYNCVPNVSLTQLARARYTATLFDADDYKAGQTIARRGQVVNAKIKAAIDLLVEKTSLDHLRQQVGQEAATTARIRRQREWLGAGKGAVILISTPVWWTLARRRKLVSLLPARVAKDGSSTTIISCPTCEETIVIPTGAMDAATDNAELWQKRALAAEQRAERAQAAIRDGVLPQLTEWLKHFFVQRLFAERKQVLAAQQSAAAELAELERRLDELHAPLQERLRAYEKRIAELEKSLALRGQENGELLRLRIQLTRQQMEAERARSRVVLN
jgi:7TM-HD extracellular